MLAWDEPSDSVKLSTTTNAKTLEPAVKRVSARVLRDMDLSPGRLASLAQDLLDQGFDIEAREWRLIGKGDFRDATPKQVASKALSGKADNLRAYHPSNDAWLSLESGRDLYEFHAFYADGDVGFTEHPGLADDLRRLDELGFKFRAENRDSLGPVYAYDRLAAGDKVHLSVSRSLAPLLGSDWIDAFASSNRKQIKSAQELSTLRYLLTGEVAMGEEPDPLAVSLRLLDCSGFDLGEGCSFDAYQNIREAKPSHRLPLSLTVGRRRLPVGELTREEMEQPDRLQRKVAPMKEALQQLGLENMRFFHQTPTELSLMERLGLSHELKALPGGVYSALVQELKSGADLQAELKLARDAPSGLVYRQLRQLGLTQRGDFLQAHQEGFDTEIALGLVQQFAKPEEINKAKELANYFGELFGDRQLGGQVMLAAGLEADLDWVESLAAAKVDSPQSLYGLGEGLDREARVLLLKLGRNHGSEALTAVWSELMPHDSKELQARSEAWSQLREAADPSSLEGINEHFIEIVHDYPPDEVVEKLKLFRWTLEGAGGDLERAKSSWSEIRDVEDSAVMVGVYARTGDLKTAAVVSELVSADYAELAETTVEERAQALAAVAQAHGREQTKGNYEFLRETQPEGSDFGARARLFAAAKDPSTARVSVAVFDGSDYRESAAAAESLGHLLQLDELSRVRDAWESLESKTPGERESARALLKSIARMNPEPDGKGLELYQVLEDYPITDGRALGGLPQSILFGKDQEAFLKKVLTSESSPELRNRELKVLGQLCEQGVGREFLSVWPQLREHLDAPLSDLTTLVQQVPEPELLRKVLKSRGAGESLSDLAEVARLAGSPDDFLDFRQFLEKGAPEGNELEANTAFLAEMNRMSSVSQPKKLLQALFTPVGNESTAQRRDAIGRLAKTFDSTNELVLCWETVTRHCDLDSEKFHNWVDQSQTLQRQLGRSMYDFMDFVGTQQARRPGLTLEKAIEIAIPHLVEGSTLHQVEQLILQQESFDIQMGADSLTVGDFTLPVN